MGNAKNQQLWLADDNFDQTMPLDPGTTYFEDSAAYFNPAYQGTDGITGKILPLRNDTNAANFVGMLRDLNPVNIYGTNQTPNQPSQYARVSRRGRYLMYVTAGETYNPFTYLYIGADEQTITTSAGSNKVGYVDPEQPIVVGAVAGTQIWVQIRAVFPDEDKL